MEGSSRRISRCRGGRDVIQHQLDTKRTVDGEAAPQGSTLCRSSVNSVANPASGSGYFRTGHSTGLISSPRRGRD